MYTKTVVINTDWLHEIDGLTVAKAIEYLSMLDPSYVLDYSMEGDTHGCSVTSALSYKVQMTNKEIFSQIEKHCLKEIKLHEDAKAKHIAEGRTSRVESCNINLNRLHAKLEEAKAKYL